LDHIDSFGTCCHQYFEIEVKRLLMNIRGLKFLVIGLGKTGIATTRFLIGQGARVLITDTKNPMELAEVLTELKSLSPDVEFAGYDPAALADVDMVIPSPGVPPASLLLSEAVRRNISIMSELELAYRFLKTPVIAITGTNGKTTTTTLIGNILSNAGKSVFVGGNIGNPLIGYVNSDQNADYAVVEISSFQLQWIQQFRPYISVLLNTTCDHVDYHGTFEAYRAVKARIFENQTKEDFAVLNGDDPQALDLKEHIAPQTLVFSTTKYVRDGMFLDHNTLALRLPDVQEEEYPLDMIKIPGLHNIENCMAAIMAARLCNCSPDSVKRTIESFTGIAHRIEFTAEKQGVLYYDDSKGTNVGAVVRALESFSQPIILLLGGRDKEGDFETLAPLIKERVKELVLFGEARQRINDLIGGIVKTTAAATLREAIETAKQNAVSGDIVLLSPGCASFDEFSNYKERGRFFKEIVGNE
jgi:UDP-N-acetylmuramoylalanine--D-glutamate ligase